MLMMMAVQVRPRRKGIFFRWQQTTPLFTPPTLKRRGKGCKGSSNQMSMGTFFRRHRHIEKKVLGVPNVCVCNLPRHARANTCVPGWLLCARSSMLVCACMSMRARPRMRVCNRGCMSVYAIKTYEILYTAAHTYALTFDSFLKIHSYIRNSKDRLRIVLQT